MADKYRVSVDELITSYSSYTATATSMGVTQKDQQTIYEALTRACKTHLATQEQTTGVIDTVSLAMRKALSHQKTVCRGDRLYYTGSNSSDGRRTGR